MPDAIFIFLFCTYVALWLWSLIHCLQNRRLTDTNRLIAVLLIVLLGLLGSFIYLFMANGNGQASNRGRGRSGRLASGSGSGIRTSGRPMPKKKIIFPPPGGAGGAGTAS